MEKDTIWKDEKAIKDKIRECEQVLPVGNEVLAILKGEGIERTIDHVKGFYTGSADYLIGVLGKTAREKVEKMDLPEKLKRSLLRDATEIDQPKVTRIHSEFYRALATANVKVDDLEINKKVEKLQLKKAFLKAIEEKNTVTIDTPAKKEMWSSIQNFCNAFNSMEEVAKRTGILSIQNTIDVDEAFIMIIHKEGNYAKAEPDPSFFLGFQGIGKLASKETGK